MNEIRITNILSDAIVRCGLDRSQLYQVLSVVDSETSRYIIGPVSGGDTKVCTLDQLQLAAIPVGKRYIDQHGNEVTYDELLRRQEFA